MSVCKYTEDFFRLSLRSGIKEPKYQCVARYVNGLKYAIQDEMRTHYFCIMDEAYQVSLKVEEKVERKTQQKFSGKGPRGRVMTSTVKEYEKEVEATSKISARGNGVGSGRGFGRVRGKYVITCYRCGVESHKASECPERQGPSNKGDARIHMTMVDEASIAGENVIVLLQEQGENLMFRRVLLKP